MNKIQLNQPEKYRLAEVVELLQYLSYDFKRRKILGKPQTLPDIWVPLVEYVDARLPILVDVVRLDRPPARPEYDHPGPLTVVDLVILDQGVGLFTDVNTRLARTVNVIT